MGGVLVMERFILTQLPDGRWKVVDTSYHVALIFKAHDFNDSQESVIMDNKAYSFSAIELARSMREIGDWMRENHYELVF